jgi:hypothetical protein
MRPPNGSEATACPRLYGKLGQSQRRASHPLPQTALQVASLVRQSRLCIGRPARLSSKLFDAIRDLFRARNDRTGNLPLFPGIFPDQMAPIVRRGADGDREIVMARWGMPGPPQFGGQPVTNVRNIKSPHWRRWLGQASRCIVPATSFCEYADTKPRKTPNWFALSDDRPLFAFAGLWTPWRGVRGPKSAPQRDRCADPPQGHAGHTDDTRRDRSLASL